jgi:hypothetical protein
VADMGPCQRPGSTGEGTETLAYGKGPQPSGTSPSIRLPDTGVCRLRIAVPFDRSALRNALSTVRLDDRQPPITEPER